LLTAELVKICTVIAADPCIKNIERWFFDLGIGLKVNFSRTIKQGFRRGIECFSMSDSKNYITESNIFEEMVMPD
jgi:hypothetical protein